MTLARGKTRRGKDKVAAEIEAITAKPWVRRVIRWELAGGQPRDLRLLHVDQQARAALEEEIFGKHVLMTDHDDWPVPEVVAGYRSQSEAEFSFRQMKDTRVVSFSPMHHWTEHNIRVHVFTCVLALQIADLMRLHAARAGLRISVRELLRELAGIGETVLLLPRRPGPARAHRNAHRDQPAAGSPASSASTATPPDADVGNTRKPPPKPHSTSQNSLPSPQISKLGLALAGNDPTRICFPLAGGDRPGSFVAGAQVTHRTRLACRIPRWPSAETSPAVALASLRSAGICCPAGSGSRMPVTWCSRG